MKKRLRKMANDEVKFEKKKDIDLDGAIIILDQLDKSIDILNESYIKLFENLNSLYSEYPKLYDELKKVVKFPDERNAEDIAEMKIDFDDIRDHYHDKEYLSSILDLYKN